MSLRSINFLHLTVSEIQPGQDFIGQGHYSKGQIKVRPRRCTSTHPTNVPTKYQLPTPYSFRDIARTRFYRSSTLRQCQRSNQGHTMTLHTYYPQPMSSPSIGFLHLTVSEIQPGQDFIGQGHYGKGQIKVRPRHCTSTPSTNVPTKYQLPTPYSFQDIARKRFSNSRSLRQGQRSNQGQTMTLHTYTPNQCPCQV